MLLDNKKIIFSIIAIILIATSCVSNNINKNDELEGNWFIEFQSNDIGIARTNLQFETGNGNFEAYTRKNADKEIVGWWTSKMGRIFTNSFDNGSLLRVTNGVYHHKNDTLILSGIFVSAMANYYFDGYVTKGELTAKLTDGAKTIKGTMKGFRKEVQRPLENYSELFGKAIKLTEDKIFNKDLIHNKKWKTFVEDMGAVSCKVQDDIEMVFAFFYFANKLPFSHYALLKPDKYSKDDVQTDDKYVFLEEKSPNTVYMKITSFSGAANEMDSVFNIIKQKNYENLIVDLRNNGGGSIEAGMAFAKNLFKDTTYGGVFLTQHWFNKHKQPPTIKEYESFQHFSDTNYNLLMEGFDNLDGMCLKIVPNEKTYDGNVFILTNNFTASTCEPIVYGLKQQNRAIVIGETTAGKMLSMKFFDLDRGFSMMIPISSYYTSDGKALDQVGVEPNIKVKQVKALDYVLDNILKLR